MLTKHKRPSREYVDRIDRLKLWRKNMGKKIRVQSDIVLPKDILEDIAGKDPNELTALKELMREVPWRFHHYGEEILQVIMQG